MNSANKSLRDTHIETLEKQIQVLVNGILPTACCRGCRQDMFTMEEKKQYDTAIELAKKLKEKSNGT